MIIIYVNVVLIGKTMGIAQKDMVNNDHER